MQIGLKVDAVQVGIEKRKLIWSRGSIVQLE